MRSLPLAEPTDLPVTRHGAPALPPRDAASPLPAMPPSPSSIRISDRLACAGAKLVPFSPLADEPPPENCDSCWLPGGYPELHAGRIAAASRFLAGLRRFAETRPVHGECGGYMVLGRTLIDADGTAHAMANLLSVEPASRSAR